jgi:rhamnosyltransferase
MGGPAVSVVIPVKNAGRFLDAQLASVFSQEGEGRPEVVVVDSGSIDDTLSIAARRGARVVRIRPEEFNHGETRNLGAGESSGGLIVFLTQDALPADGAWLRNLCAPLRGDPSVAGSFSRHIPRPGCPLPLERQIVEEWPQGGGLDRIVKRVGSRRELEERKPYFVYFANTSSCLRRSVWERFPFRRVEFGEDADWAERVLLAGYAVVYEPSSAVIHSHDLSLREQLRQHYDYGRFVRAARLAPPITVGRSAKTAAVSLRDDISYARRKGLPAARLLYSLPYHSACVLGRWLGEHSEALPARLRAALSRQKKILDGAA